MASTKVISIAPSEQAPHAGVQAFKLLALTVLGLSCGFLAYNYTYILQVSDVHLTLHQHRAFIGYLHHNGKSETSPGGRKAGAGGSDSTASKVVSKEDDDAAQMRDMLHILSTRVCGSPAVDGYAHVVPSCLESSPTNKWWQAYYEAGGRQADLVVHIEEAADYDGLAVKWGIKNTVASAQECAQQCLEHLPKQIPGPFTNLPCNAFAYCPEENCFEPDAHSHSKGDCWLKFTEGPAAPEVNMRGTLPPDYRQRHPNAPSRVQWTSGVLLPPGVQRTNGTWGPRWSW